jgi:predicted flap endonuclease-1-like 5' DNA nuclease
MDLNTAVFLGITVGILFFIIYIGYNFIKRKEKINDIKGYIKKTDAKKIIKKEEINERERKLIVNENIKRDLEINRNLDHFDIKSDFNYDIIYDRKLTTISGIGVNYEKKLNRIGIIRISDLYNIAMEKNGIDKISESTGIYKKLLEKWTIQADLLRIRDINNQQLDRLIEIGIHTISDLAESSPDIIHKKLLENSAYSEIPSIGMLQRWIRIAKKIVEIDEKNKFQAQLRERAYKSLWR